MPAQPIRRPKLTLNIPSILIPTPQVRPVLPRKANGRRIRGHPRPQLVLRCDPVFGAAALDGPARPQDRRRRVLPGIRHGSPRGTHRTGERRPEGEGDREGPWRSRRSQWVAANEDDR